MAWFETSGDAHGGDTEALIMVPVLTTRTPMPDVRDKEIRST